VPAVPLVEVRCRYCSKLQWKQDADALRAGKRIEVKCERCNQYSVHVGPTDQKPAEVPRHQATTDVGRTRTEL
jgi:phage FluMu protein Com